MVAAEDCIPKEMQDAFDTLQHYFANNLQGAFTFGRFLQEQMQAVQALAKYPQVFGFDTMEFLPDAECEDIADATRKG